MDIITKVLFMEQLRNHEGQNKRANTNSKGMLVVGVNHNCDLYPVPGVTGSGDYISEEMVNSLFYQDIKRLEGKAYKHLPWLSKLNGPRQAVILNLAFHDLNWLLRKQSFLECVEKGDFETAASWLLTTYWAEANKERASHLSEQIKTGKWQGILFGGEQ